MASTAHIPSRTFQSTRPIRGATTISETITRDSKNFNPRAPYGARLEPVTDRYRSVYISIHAPHTGRDAIIDIRVKGQKPFQSTRPMRGATTPRLAGRDRHIFQSTRPIRGATLIAAIGRALRMLFQSTRPIRGATLRPHTCTPQNCRFQSTRPIRGATIAALNGARNWSISIHAPHTGRDQRKDRSAWGRGVFQSTRPIRGATLS